ncbi:YceD family protein [Sandaracinobacteroides sp. A072]|uniref:YceD family protein n=1 Tax=Sandaracinobacteroides sp. A072 TaxID=3461146 RepID=UPI004042F64B
MSRNPEFSVRMTLDRLPGQPKEQALVAGPEARAALAERFGLIAIDRLEATLAVSRHGRGARVSGRLVADVVQRCVVSSEPVPAHVEEALDLRFEPEAEIDPGTELELEEDALDILPVENGGIDLGEAVAQSLALVLDPYPRASDEVLARVRAHLTTEEEAAAAEEAEKARNNPFSRLRTQ